MAEYVQDELPLFGEPILPGDIVRMTGLTHDDDAGDDEYLGAGSYLDEVGQVVDLEPKHLYPYAVKFSDGAEFMYDHSELERLA